VVVNGRRGAPTPALVVPDEMSWTMWGLDPQRLGVVPVSTAEHARAMLAPTHVPAALVEAVVAEWRRIPARAHATAQPGAPLRGVPLEEALGDAGAHDGHHTPASQEHQHHPDADDADELVHAGHAQHGGHGMHVGHAMHPGHSADEHDAASREMGDHGGHAGDGAHAEHGAHEEHGGQDEHGAHGAHEAHDGHESHASHGEHGGHGGHDHHDMMAIVGDPSRDGLVMESIEFAFGPLSGVLPGGVVAEVALDGDVVERCEVRAMLAAGRDGDPQLPDPLSPVAWRVAGLVATEVASEAIADLRAQWSRVAALEAERALSHLAWLRSFARLLGWPQLVGAAQAALAPLASGRRLPGEPPAAEQLEAAAQAIGPAIRLVMGRRFERRLTGRGALAGAQSGLAGVNARAAGAPRDARGDDPLYAELGFVPTVSDGADALARAGGRVAEARAALDLATRALERAQAARTRAPGVALGLANAGGASIEGPRGPVLASRSAPAAKLRVAAPGAGAARAAAGGAAVGQEWSAALVTLASFDLSPWAVGDE